MKGIKLIVFLTLVILLSTCIKKNDAKGKNESKAVYVDKDGITRIDPLKIKVGDVINGWKVARIDIKKFDDPVDDKKMYYFMNKKENQKDFSAEIEFDGNFQFNGEFSLEEKDFMDNFIVVNTYAKEDDRNFPRLNYEIVSSSLLLNLRVDNYKEIYNKMFPTHKYVSGTTGKAIFIIDKYIIDHVDSGYYPYGRIHVVEVKDVKVENGK